MILKSIEVKGFKSFADKTELLFQQGITAVIGPNGSGKSNISDAIRWCLGEQSAKSLRGGRMEDIIFSGTQYRKALSLAEVSLTIDNSNKELPIDYSTVKISRKLYRSGESEYSINNNVCKLKDINELFYDTGIGKEGYSIIGQGKIDAILSGNSLDRRTIIEEAIGITKYKFKKEEAQNKINNANENILRIDDMLSTYMEYLVPLQLESDKSKKFIQLSNQLRDVEIMLIYNNLYQMYRELQKTNLNINDYQINLKKFLSEKGFLEDKRQISEKKLNDLKNSEQKDRKKYYKIKDIIQKHIDNINTRNNNINILYNSNDIYRKQVEDNNLKIDNITLRENIINKTKSELENEFNNIMFKLEENDSLNAQNNILISNLENRLLEMQNNQNELISKNNTINNKLEFINSTSINIENEKKLYIQEKKSIENKILEIENNFNSKNAQLDLLNKEKQNTQLLLDSLLNKINNENINLESLLDKFNTLNKLIMVRQTNLDALKEFENNYEGFNKASKLLMNEIKSGSLKEFKDKCFMLGNVIDTDEVYTLAIETVVGGHISDIIIDDYKFAKHLINHLKEHKLGRVTFHPLNSVNRFNFKFNNDLISYKGFIDFAINLVKNDAKFDNIIGNILGNTIICDNIDNALNIASNIKFSNRIVTLDSQVVNSGGSITGGSTYVKKFNILGRQKKIYSEMEGIKEQLLEFEHLKSKIELSRGVIEKLKVDFEFNNNLIQELTIKILGINEELKTCEDLRRRESIELEKKSLILKNLSDTSSANNEDINRLKIELLNNANNFDRLENDANEVKNELEMRRRVIKIEEDKVTDVKIRKAKLEENISNIYEEAKRIALEKKELFSVNENILNSIKQHDISIDKLKRSIEILDNRIISLNNKLNEYNFDKYVVEQDEIQSEINELNLYINDLNLNIHKVEQDINNLKIKNTKKEVEFNITDEGLFKKYNIKFDLNDSQKYLVSEQDLNKYNSEMKKISSDINDLGNINLKSIEEFESLNEKVNFITKQKEDLEKSKNELEEFIKDITLEMRNIFNNNFKLINQNFNITFKELFKGGNAQLLLGEGDELESKIEIIVQPPGKKLQNINLLSGGEKGLSAISLLFAILKLKPVPFCVLDEIEAALDDNNAFKFANFLKQYSSNVQFIVITHRKATMEASDIIYGVTMQEKGISKVVSINLANYNT